MHRARPFDDACHVRELRRVTTLDVDFMPGQTAMVRHDPAQV